MENKDLLKLLEKMGVEVKSVHSTLDDSDVERVKNHLNLSRKEGLVEQRVKPTVIRRRVKKEEAPSGSGTGRAGSRPAPRREAGGERRLRPRKRPAKKKPPRRRRPLEKKSR